MCVHTYIIHRYTYTKREREMKVKISKWGINHSKHLESFRCGKNKMPTAFPECIFS